MEIVENGVHYLVDVENGQKTGFFLDQKYNRVAMQRICKGKRVLDCFTHMGTFALNAGIAGATEVTGLDISDYAVSQATENAKRNGLEDRVTFRCANVFDELPRLAEAGEKYDVVILDPPAFTKSRQATKNAIKGYREINIKGLKPVSYTHLIDDFLLFRCQAVVDICVDAEEQAVIDECGKLATDYELSLIHILSFPLFVSVFSVC